MTQDENNAASLAEFAKAIPLKRAARPEEVTNLVLYLASDDSSYSTGSEFVIDGGSSPF
jgi:3alpha(or 20beta)-hydroxysteroid dehydrogenase